MTTPSTPAQKLVQPGQHTTPAPGVHPPHTEPVQLMPDIPPTDMSKPMPDPDAPEDFKDLDPPGKPGYVAGQPVTAEEFSKTEADEKKKLAEGEKTYEARDKALGVKK